MLDFTQPESNSQDCEFTLLIGKNGVSKSLMDCQARDKWKLDFAFNASFTSLNVAKVTMKEMEMEYSMSSFKSLMTNIYLVKRIFKASGYTPNRNLISKIFKDLSCLQRIAA